jgi:7,8-dihydropterin-6-yl-methyl-4-(beta-D-ribofuranosyl)aminobenzene 5'-phosphate synthase
MRSEEIRVDIVFDNECRDHTLSSLWGFSCLLQTPQQTTLFDTGSNGRVLLKNLQAKGLSVEKIDTLFLSHAHWDHIGGLDSILEINPNLDIFLTSHISKNLIRDLKTLSKSVHVIKEEATELLPDIHSTGAMGEASEQSIIMDTQEGLIIIAGCAHSGIARIVQRAKSLFDKEILLLLGGFHLFNKTESELHQIITDIQKAGTRYVAPSHCTGADAKALFAQKFGDYYIDGGAGVSLTFHQQEVVMLP